MPTPSPQRSWLRKLVKGTLILVGGAALLLVTGIVGFRLLVTQLPSYQDDLQAWVNDTLGVRLTFARVNLRWGWRGPELMFLEASLAANNDVAPFLTAREAGVGVSPFALLARLFTASELGIERLTLEGTEITVVKAPDGSFRVEGAPDSAARRADFAMQVPPDVEIYVRESRVLYLDQSRGFAWDFQDVDASMRRDSDSLLLDARARPPSDFARSVEVTAQGVIEAGGAAGERRLSGDWRVSADARGIDLAVASRLLPSTNVLPRSGRGDVALWVELQAGVPVGGNASVALADVDLPGVAGEQPSRYERIELAADWQRSAAGWRVALQDLAIERAGRAWPARAAAEVEVAYGADPDAGLARLTLRSDFVRLEDLTPLLATLPESRLRDAWFELAPRGDLENLDVQLSRAADDGIDYSLSGGFAGLGIAPFGEWPGFTAVSGAVRADSRSGRVELDSSDAGFDWPAVFRVPLEIAELDGIVVWRKGQDALRVVSDDLVLATRDASSRTNLELTFPMDGSSPRLDLEASVSGFDLGVVSRYLPAAKMPPKVVAWLDDALRGGRVSAANVTFFGPVRAFPFDAGEGEFRAVLDLEDGDLQFLRDWPHAEELDGVVEFVNARFEARGSGRTLGNRTADVRVGIGDLRDAVLTLQADTIGPLGEVLAFLKGAPLIANYLGPDFARLEAPSGTGEVGLDLSLPLRDMQSFGLVASLGIIDGELAYRGFGPHATEIQGMLEVRDGALRGEGIEAIFLDGPVTASVGAPDSPGYRTRLDLDGEVTIDAVIDAFNLPFTEQLAGQTSWHGSLLIPDVGDPAVPPRITVDSNLSGIALRFPEPFAKPPGEPTNLQVGMAFTAGGGLEIEGHVGPARRFAAQFDPDPNGVEGKFAFRRGALEFGGGMPELRHERGMTVGGNLPVLRVGDWLPFAKALAEDGSSGSGFGSAFAGGDLEVTDFVAFGQQLGSTKISTRRLTDDWQIALDSAAVAGTVLVPVDLDRDPQIVAVMQRLYLSVGEGGLAEATGVDPRRLPGLQLHANEFAIGPRQLGQLDAEILSDPLGLRLASFESSSESFGAQGSGGWFTGDDGDTTRFAVSVSSSDVGATLQALGFDPIIEAESAEVTASLYWPGPPGGAWMDHVGGDVALKASKGTLNDVQPGAGRVVGLLSFSALPRRLALDFRDVFNRGFVFDDINADFVVIDGNAYTDNLKLTGPIADIGLIGRTGLRDHDYRQQAVVTAEPSKMLPTVGALLGGAGVGAAILIFTRIFKKPLAGLGRASYCLTGTWQEPMVERLTQEQLDNGEICAELPPNGAPAEVAAR